MISKERENMTKLKSQYVYVYFVFIVVLPFAQVC